MCLLISRSAGLSIHPAPQRLPSTASRPIQLDPIQYLQEDDGDVRIHRSQGWETYLLFQQRDEQRQPQSRQVSPGVRPL